VANLAILELIKNSLAMKQAISLFLVIFLLLFGCKAKKIPVSTVENEKKIVVVEPKFKASTFQIGSLDDIDKEDLMFNLKGMSLEEDKLVLNVQYGGGCLKPHVFELVTDGVIDNSGTMDFYLLHKTHDDRCKALLMETLVFDFKPLYDLQSEKLMNYRINNNRKMEL
jgi:hypothetical protein